MQKVKSVNCGSWMFIITYRFAYFILISLRFGLSTGIFLSALKSYGCNADSIRDRTHDMAQFFIVVRAIIL